MNKIIILIALIAFTGCSSQPLGSIINDRFTPCPGSPNCVSSMEEGKSAISPFLYEGTSISGARTIVLDYLKEEKHFTLITADDDYIHGSWKVPPFGFIDDVEFLFKEEVIHMKSSSRVGYSDLGENRRRLKKVTRALEKLF